MMTMSNKFPDVLYHYTSLRVLLSIVRNRSIWLGSRHQLNDSREGSVFVQHLRSYAEAQGIDKSKAADIAEKLDKLEAYVNCMTSERDMLSQWRGYAAGGAGVSIGFKSAALLKAITGNPVALLREITYADEPADLDVQADGLAAALSRRTGASTADFVQTIAKFRWAVKNKAFREECEFRLILTPTPESSSFTFQSGATAARKYRESEFALCEYYELSFPGPHFTADDLIHEVVLGPRNTSDVETVKRMLRGEGFTNVNVDRSNASYR